MSTEAERIAALEAEVKGIRASVNESRMERHRQYEDISDKLDTLIVEVTEYRGAIRFGKWVVGTLIGIGIPSAFLY